MLVSVLLARGIYAALKRRGLDADAWLQDCGVDQGMFADVRFMLPVATWDGLLQSAMERSGDRALGLTLGFGEVDGLLQIFGYMLQSSRTLAEAVEVCQRYSPLVVDAMKVELTHVGKLSHFSFDFHQAASEDSLRFGAELVMALAIRFGRRSFSARHVREIRFKHAQPEYAARVQQLFEVPVLYGQPDNELVFDRAVLLMPQAFGDRQVMESLTAAADKLMREMRRSPALSERVRALLNHEPELGSIDAEQIAAKLGMNARTLRRRLRAEGLGIRELIDESRMRVACTNLLHPKATIKDTAERLGYSEPSAFHRAFKRWTGRTPSEFLRSDTDPLGADGVHILSQPSVGHASAESEAC